MKALKWLGPLVALQLLAIPAVAQQSLVSKLEAEQGIEVSIEVRDLNGGSVFSFQPERDMVLASNTKLFTTAAALEALGADFRWKTKFYLNQQRLLVVGGGDPSLRETADGDMATALLDRVATLLKQREVYSLREVVFDGSYFAGDFRHQDWPQKDWQKYYCAPVSALSVSGNCLTWKLKKGSLAVTPPLGGDLKIKRRKVAPKAPMDVSYLGSGLEYLVKAGAESSAEATIAVQNPRQLFESWFIQGLRQRGVSVAESNWWDQQSPIAWKSTDSELYTHQSAWSLSEAIAVTNKDSDNFVSEVLLKTIAAESGHQATWAGGVQAINASLQNAGWKSGNRHQVDGSGLARNWNEEVNTATTSQVCDLLEIMAEHEDGATFFDSLPVAGVEGRLKVRFNEDVFKPQRVHAKTGWIIGASALSGYLFAGDNDMLCFSIVVNYKSDGKPRTNNARFKQFQQDVLAEILEKWN